MKRSWRWYLAWGTMVASLSLLLFTATAGPAHGWTQNVITVSYVNGTPVVTLCGNSSSLPCQLWQEPRNTSIHLYFYMDPSLNTASVNFVSVLQNAFSQYNGISAWNPYMNVWQSGDPTVGGSYTLTPLPACDVYGATFDITGDLSNIPPGEVGPATQGYNASRGVTEWYQFILYPPVYFNSAILWNTSGDWSASGCTIHADARKVALHETGHVIGLGHTYKKDANGNPVPAIMREGPPPTPMTYCSPTTSCVLQTEDIAGVQGIYPGNQEH